MASNSKDEYDFLEQEVKELLLNYKYKNATVYEPCTRKNFKECIIGLTEEFQLLNIDYVFNPYCDVTVDQTLHPEALVKFVNAIWTVLHYHKATVEKAEKLVERNNVLEHSNNHLKGAVHKLKENVNTEKHEAKTCLATVKRVSDHFDEITQTLTETKAKLTLANKQKEALEKSLRNEISRLKRENEKLSDRLRNKRGSFTPCSEVCDSRILVLKERDKKQQAIITKLQGDVQGLLKEVLAMKEKIILHGIK